MRKAAQLLLVAAIALPIADQGHSDSYLSEAFATTPKLGQGLFSKLVQLREPCLTGEPRYIKQSIAEVNLDYHRSHANETRRLVMAAAHGANVLIVKGKQTVKLTELFHDTSLQTTLVYRAKYVTKISGEGGQLALSPLGEKLVSIGDPDMIKQNCGEHFVSKLVYGGELNLFINFRFRTMEAKREIENKIEVSVLGLKKVIKNTHYSESARKETEISIAAMQHGGDPKVLEQILGNHPTHDCELTNPKACDELVGALIEYAIETKQGFPSQLDSNPLRIETKPYFDSPYGVLAEQAPPAWDYVNQESLFELTEKLAEQLSLKKAALQARKQGRVDTDMVVDWEHQLTLVTQNILAIRSGIAACNRTPLGCHDIQQGVFEDLNTIDKGILVPKRK